MYEEKVTVAGEAEVVGSPEPEDPTYWLKRMCHSVEELNRKLDSREKTTANAKLAADVASIFVTRAIRNPAVATVASAAIARAGNLIAGALSRGVLKIVTLGKKGDNK